MMTHRAGRPPEEAARPVSNERLREAVLAARGAGASKMHLSAAAHLVPPSLLAPPFANERRGVLHDEAAALLDRHLRRLARLGNPVELRAARLLGRMKRLSAYLDLGFARLTDYAVESLGISARRAQVLTQIDDGLRRLPAIAAAYETGRLSHSQVLLLVPVATPATEGAWIEKAGSMNVRKLDKEVRRARAVPAQEEDAASPPGAASSAGDSLNEDDEPHVQVSLPAPDWVRGRWDWAVELYRRTAGAAAPIWQAAEGFAAEYLSGIPGAAADESIVASDASAGATNGSTAADDSTAANDSAGAPDASSGCPQSDDDDAGIDLFEEVQRALEDELGISKWAPPADVMEVNLPPGLDADDCEEDAPRDAAALDHRLRGLIDIRQNLAWHQGRLLRTFANYRLYRALGFRSFSRYCRENLGMSVSRAWQLIALARRLLELPALERAYRRGELSRVKAFEISRVAQPDTEKAWLRLGCSVTARRLRDEVALALADLENEALPPEARRGLPRGLDPDGRVQLSAPQIQPPPDPDTAPDPDAAPDDDVAPALAAAAGAGVQTSAPAAAPGEVQSSAPTTTADPDCQTSARSNLIATRIHFRAPADVAQLWRQALAACRAVEGDHLQDWECVVRMLDSFRRTWDLRGSAGWRRRYRIFERDGWRCRVPGCTSRRNLHGHHVVFRSEGGGDQDDNLVTVCATHHLRCLHTGGLRCHRLPGGLFAWEFGASPGATSPDRRPMARFVEDVVWEAAREAVRSLGDSPPDDLARGTPPCSRLTPEHATCVTADSIMGAHADAR
jgi:hypothetical protein